MAGRDDVALFAAEQPALACVRIEAGHRQCGAAARARRPAPDARCAASAARASTLTASMASRSDIWMLTSTVRSSSLASIMRTGNSATSRPRCAAASACSNSVWPGKAEAGGGQRLLVQRRRDQRRDLAAQGGARRPCDALAGHAAGRCADLADDDGPGGATHLQHRHAARRHVARHRLAHRAPPPATPGCPGPTQQPAPRAAAIWTSPATKQSAQRRPARRETP